ncbi:hypothetical protein HK101_003973, partial [Irineochytrium annulatum]
MPRLPPELWAVILSLASDSFADLLLQRSINQSVSDFLRDLPAYRLARNLAQLRSMPSSSRLDLLRLFRDSGRQHPNGFVDRVRLAIKDGTLTYEDDKAPNTLYRFKMWFRGERYKPVIDLLTASGFKRPFWREAFGGLGYDYHSYANRIEAAFPLAYQFILDEYNTVNAGWARV